MSDILRVLRAIEDQNTDGIIGMAADEIERLRARVANSSARRANRALELANRSATYRERWIGERDQRIAALEADKANLVREYHTATQSLIDDKRALEADRERLDWVIEQLSTFKPLGNLWFETLQEGSRWLHWLGNVYEGEPREAIDKAREGSDGGS